MSSARHPLTGAVRPDGWEQVRDPSDRRRTVYWRHNLRPLKRWLSVKREGGAWTWTVHASPGGRLETGTAPTLAQARRAADQAASTRWPAATA